MAWLALLAFTVAWLFGVLVCATFTPPGKLTGSQAHRAWILLRGSPVALTIAAFLGLTGFAYCVRRLELRRLAWSPGPVEVPDFALDAPIAPPADGRAPATGARAVPIVQLSMLFRERLAAVHLRAPDAVPAAPEQQDFLQLLSAAARTPSNVLGTIAGLLASMLPRAAYRVRGTLLERGGDRPFGVVVHVVTMPRSASAPMAFWDRSWDAAVETAAYAVAAYMLPRTAACRQQPWTVWQGTEMPARVVASGTRASDATLARHYDRALAAYYDAIEVDPRNLQLRLETGLLQEKLALWLDAFATYDDLVKLVRRGPVRLSPSLRALTAWRAQGRLVLLARYRRAILLGFGERLANEWCREGTDECELRAEERTALRCRLGPVFLGELDKLGKVARQPERLERILGATEGQVDESDDLCLRELFAQVSQRELGRIAYDMSGLATLWNAAGLTRRGLRVAIDVADLRRRRSSALVTREMDVLPTLRAVDRRAQRQVRWARRDDWQAHYNAACLYAVTLLPDEHGGFLYELDDRRRLAGFAVQQLERAVSMLDSGTLARRRTWIVSADPDLAGLRRDPLFARFEARHFPASRAAALRPSDVHRLELARYTSRLLRIAAEELADEWRRRAVLVDNGNACNDLMRWLEEEEQAVAHFAATAREHRHWQTRVELLCELERWASANARSLPQTAYLDYGEDPLAIRAEQLDQLARERVSALQEAMQNVACHEALVRYEQRRDPHHAAWLHAVRRSTTVRDGAIVCLDRAHWWDWLGTEIARARDGRSNGRAGRPPHLRGPVVSARKRQVRARGMAG